MVLTTADELSQLKNDYGDWGKVLTINDFIETIKADLSENQFLRRNSRLVFSVCPDDVNRLEALDTIEDALKENYDGEFHLGGLGAYPMGGVSGIIAASHHPPDNIIDGNRIGGNLIFFISPHLGIIEKEEFLYGKIVRPGQQKITNSCGAMMGFLGALKEAGSAESFQIAPDPNDLDPTRIALHNALIQNYADTLNHILILQNENQQIIDMFKLNYNLVASKAKKMIETFLQIEKDHFEGNIALIGGITVNTPAGDHFILKEIAYPKL
ncbi:MAG: hypothetical protein BAJALOKI1v1_50026 [Promethearchaeota archaeon]|nr:MAG: hypothetical protein BAJALOKI1v1_50026 [Candidatus Lokiarchaeota archaeon]